MVTVPSETARADAAGLVSILRNRGQITRLFRRIELENDSIAGNINAMEAAFAAHIDVIPIMAFWVEELALVFRAAFWARVDRTPAGHARPFVRMYGFIGIAALAGVIDLLTEACKLVCVQQMRLPWH